MKVASILNGKGDSIVAVQCQANLQTAAELLSSHKIGAVVVHDDDGSLAGILSERDIVRAIAHRGPSALEAPVTSAMTDRVVTCRSSDTVDHVMELMTGGRFRHMPVVDENDMRGIISIGDVVKHHIAEVEMEASALKTYLVAG